MEQAIDEDTAAVILEVVQGEGGVVPGDGDYLRGVQDCAASVAHGLSSTRFRPALDALGGCLPVSTTTCSRI